MISAAEQHVLGCPLPASVVERTESIRRRVAIFISAGTRAAASTAKETSGKQNYSRSAFRVLASGFVFMFGVRVPVRCSMFGVRSSQLNPEASTGTESGRFL